MSVPEDIKGLQQRIWDGSLPLEIRLAASECRTYDESDAYFIQYPRLSYLPFLLPRLHAFFASSLIHADAEPHNGWFSFENVPLKWHYPLGLLHDLFSGAEPYDVDEGLGPSRRRGNRGSSQDNGDEDARGVPWRLCVHFTDFPDDQLIALDAEGKVMHDAFINSVKEADFLRNGTAKVVMGLSKDDSTQLWHAVQRHDLRAFNAVNQKLLNPPGTPLRHIPMKFYLPATPPSPHSPRNKDAPASAAPAPAPAPAAKEEEAESDAPPTASLRVVQALVTPWISAREPQTLGTALHALLPTVFPSRRRAILARAVLHGAVVPLGAGVEELLRGAGYADGFLHVALAVMG